ncbi:MAG: hypothetical protein AAF696_31490, partial [Bacteroidota bacterium]
WHYMVLIISYGEKANRLLLALFSEAVNAFRELEAGESRVMEDQLVKYLANWAMASLDPKEARTRVVEFLGELLYKTKRINHAFESKLKEWDEHKERKVKTLSSEIKSARRSWESVRINLNDLSL